MCISDWSSDVCSSDLRMPSHRPLRIAMLYAIIATDVENSLENRLAARPPHLASLEQLKSEGRRSEERRVGKECVSTGRSRWSTYHSNTNTSSSQQTDETTRRRGPNKNGSETIL